MNASGFLLWPLGLSILLSSSGQTAEPARYEFESRHMGTVFRIVLYASSPKQAEQASKQAFQRVAKLDQTLSDYNPKSEMMLLCKANDASPGKAFSVSPELFHVLQESQRIAKLTEGYFDITVGPVVKLWRLARRTQLLPESQELDAARKLVGYKQLTLNPTDRTVRFEQAKIRLDFGGIGKGYAADEALKVLQSQGIQSALVAASGDITCSEPPPGQTGWLVEILPLTKSEPIRKLRLANRSVSTSGDLDQFVVIDGVRYSHVLNPKTGIGLKGRRSVTVISRNGAQTDALTKAASTMPPEQALKLIESLPDTAAFWAIQESEESPVQQTSSKRFSAYLAK